MATKKMKAPSVDAAFMFAFEGNLRRLHRDEVYNIVCDLGDLSADSDTVISYGELPKAIPEVIRRRIVALSVQQMNLAAQVNDIITKFETAAEKVDKQMERDEDKAKPHCTTCGQILPAKRSKAGHMLSSKRAR